MVNAEGGSQVGMLGDSVWPQKTKEITDEILNLHKK
jgi:hypothetical protein